MGFHGLGFFDRDDTVIPDLFHGVGNQAADFFVAGGNGGNLCLGFLGDDFLGVLLQGVNQRVHSGLDALLQDHGVGTGSHVLHAFVDHGLGQQRCGRGAVAGHVVRLGGDFLDQLGAHVFKRVFQFDVPGNRHTVVGDGRGTVFLIEHDVAAFGSQGDLDGIRQCIDAAFQGAASFFVE